MGLEAAIFQQDPFNYGCKDYSYSTGGGYIGLGNQLPLQEGRRNPENLDGYYWDSPPSSVAQNADTSSPEVASSGRLKRRRKKSMVKNKLEMENQRMTHIAVERNRRRQMNDYLAILRSLMPPSFALRGDQASIVGGAINFVKELEQLLQFLEAANQERPGATRSALFSGFFAFPQYSTRPSTTAVDAAVQQSSMADIEVTMVESHANIKLLTKRRPKQTLRLVAGFQSVYLSILHLNITTVDQSVLYSFIVKVEDECKLNTVKEIATNVHEMIGIIQEESLSS